MKSCLIYMIVISFHYIIHFSFQAVMAAVCNVLPHFVFMNNKPDFHASYIVQFVLIVLI